MPPLYRIAEVGAYSLLQFLPMMALALYPFRNRMRFSPAITYIITAAMAVVQVLLGLWAAFFSGGRSGMVSMVSTVLYAGFYFLAVKARFSKLVFTLLMLSNYANFIVVSSKCIEGQLFPALALQPYRWSNSLVMLCVEAVFFTPLFRYFKHSYTPAVETEPSGFEWRYLWMVPAVFYLVWFYGLYGIAGRTSLEVALRPANSVFFFFVNLGAFLVYYVVARLIFEQSRNLGLEARNHSLAMQKLQYDVLQDKIDEARRAKHDVHHHIALMREYLSNKEYDKLDEYLREYQATVPEDTPVTFCDNAAANAVLMYFAQQARSNGVAFTVKLVCPKEISIPETDLSVLLGNLLENALQACMSDRTTPPADKKIIVRGTVDQNTLCIGIDNTFSGHISTDSEGRLLSTKHLGHGIGIESVRVIAERYHGTVQLKPDGGLFMASVLLNCPAVEAM